MQNSKVLALKYRPKNFKDIIGQNIIAETIYRSIEINKIPNAYLFHGIRGTGKTSIARIIAKAMNCENGIKALCSDKLCKACEDITNSNHLDVIEQDCATATGIDSVRDLIEFCRYPPSSAKYKVLILDEIQAMSKAGAQSLLKILEEPPEYVKFIFCTTEIKKILVTMLSRCTRFDLSRVSFQTLLEYLKKIRKLENGKISDDALKLICKCSEGSVRDALSLLDRALLSIIDNKEMTLKDAQSIFGHFDKSLIIDLIDYILHGDVEKTFKTYRIIYEGGGDPISFLNDFLEILYYIKNINSFKSSSNNFELNDQEYKQINELRKNVNTSDVILFWQFTIKTIEEIKIVSNQNISVEMFLYRLLHIQGSNFVNDKVQDDYKNSAIISNNSEKQLDNKAINQMKNISQADEDYKTKKDENKKLNEINSFEELVVICNSKKEMSLKYDLETNVNLVKFEKNMIEISFNDNLSKNFVKTLTSKLFEWTNQRWIITLSKKKGEISKKEVLKNQDLKIYNDFKNSEDYRKILNIFEDVKINNVDEN